MYCLSTNYLSSAGFNGFDLYSRGSGRGRILWYDLTNLVLHIILKLMYKATPVFLYKLWRPSCF